MLVVLALLMAIQPAGTPDPADIEALEREADAIADEAEARTEEADAVAAEIAILRARLVAAADRVRAREAAANLAEADLRDLQGQESDLLARLAEERQSLAQVLAALQRIESASPPALAVTPGDAAEAARAAGLLAAIAPQLEARARSVTDQLATLEAVRQDLVTQQLRVDEAELALQGTRTEVEALIAERRDRERELRSQSEDLSSRAAAIAAQAEDLNDLLARIRRFAAAEPRLAPRRSDVETVIATELDPLPRLRPERLSAAALRDALPLPDDMGTLRFTDARGALRPPASGQLVTGFREPGPDGQTRDGVWFATRPAAQVAAPFDGTVVYAGNFQSLNGVLLINTADGYTLVIGGMALIYASEGQSVLAGEPLGMMPDRGDPPARLYFGILRSTDQAENPEPWLRPEFRRG